jgi:hypothetical protein
MPADSEAARGRSWDILDVEARSRSIRSPMSRARRTPAGADRVCAAMHGEVDVIAGHRHAQVGTIRFAERDEAERLPERAHGSKSPAGMLYSAKSRTRTRRRSRSLRNAWRFLHAHRWPEESRNRSR